MGICLVLLHSSLDGKFSRKRPSWGFSAPMILLIHFKAMMDTVTPQGLQVRYNNLCLSSRELRSFGVFYDTRDMRYQFWHHVPKYIEDFLEIYEGGTSFANLKDATQISLFPYILWKIYLKTNSWKCHLNTIWSKHHNVIKCQLPWMIKVKVLGSPR